MKLIGLDLAKENSDNTVISIQFDDILLEQMKKLWNIGDEYILGEYHRKRLGLQENNRLIIFSIYENSNKDVFMNMLIR